MFNSLSKYYGHSAVLIYQLQTLSVISSNEIFGFKKKNLQLSLLSPFII